MNKSTIAEPLHIQRLQSSLDLRPFMKYAREVLAQPLDSDTETEGEGRDTKEKDITTRKKKKRLKKFGSKQERQNMKAHIYNFKELTTEREWLYNVILSDTPTESEFSDEDDYVKEMLKSHIWEQKERENFYKKATNTQYAYFSAGLLSYTDMFPEHQQSIVGVRKRKRRTKKEKPPKLQKLKPLRMRKPRKSAISQPEPGEIDPSDLKNYVFGDTVAGNDDNEDGYSDEEITTNGSRIPLQAGQSSSSLRGRRRKSQARTPEAMAARRRRVWQLMAKKELGRYHRAKVNNHKEMMQNCKRVSAMCAKVVRQRAILSQKTMKETVWRAKRLTREMLGYWKRYERVERDTRRRLEREAEEQRKIDVELIEAKRQQRKLNFLITQTELYAHFMSRKLGQGTEQDQLRILNQLEEETNPRLAPYDDYNVEEMKKLAQKNAENAFDKDLAKKRQFDVSDKIRIKEEIIGDEDVEIEDDIIDSIKVEEETITEASPIHAISKADLPQPKMFRGTLKSYQIKGMTWLANLYDQGISGILADEMGLGKTVQSIAFLCHIAEHYGVWGPFLIISPASTLHNWQQEMARFVPDFNVVPYWGSPNERKILRQFWEQKDLHTREASFHVVITSYQLIVSDYKYFNRIKWQYMVLDEAQAIKSSSSMRWKMLLGFNCRNRLLLSGTPIQNSMAELWALLHFIMPTLFDSHDEFNEWFSKDIESHAENKTGIDEKQISRLHMILKPFMLRRIKKDVENELSDKIEIMVYCPLTIRQRLLYVALKRKIHLEDLIRLTRGGGGVSSPADGNFTSNLMNLVMQFRKVCNHPELFERRDARSSFVMRCQEYVIPRLVFQDGILLSALPSKKHLLYNKFSVFKGEHVQRTLFSEPKKKDEMKPKWDYTRYVDLSWNDSSFSFTRLCNLSPKDVEDLTLGDIITRINKIRQIENNYASLAYRLHWWTDNKTTCCRLLEPFLENPLQKFGMLEDSILRNFLFTAMTTNESTIYAFGDYKTVNMQETVEHRLIRSKHSKQVTEEEIDIIKGLNTESICSNEVELGVDNIKIIKKEMKHKTIKLVHEFPYKPRAPQRYYCEPLDMPKILYGLIGRVNAYGRRIYCESRAAEWNFIRHTQCENAEGRELIASSIEKCSPRYGWSSIIIPDKQTLVSDCGKLFVLDGLLARLKLQGHRVLIYSQMTKMIDLLEEYMWHRNHRYMRLDGSSKISERRDMVEDFQTRSDIFVFLLSTRAGGLGINLTAADTVIFYDSDWNPTVDQQAMDRAHRLGQTKQVTVYRLICKGTIEERILQRAREKSEIQRMVISGGNFKPDTLKPKEVASLLLDDEEMELRYRQRIERDLEQSPLLNNDSTVTERMRQFNQQHPGSVTEGQTIGAQMSSPGDDFSPMKRSGIDVDDDSVDVTANSDNSSPPVSREPFVPGATSVMHNNDSDNEQLIVDCESSLDNRDTNLFLDFNVGRMRRRHHPRGTKRGRPRGTRRGAGTMRPLPQNMTDSPPFGSGQSFGNEDLQQSPSTSTAATSPGFPNASMDDGSCFMQRKPHPVKRGPGRPRLKTAGPPHHGIRGSPRTRKPIGPLIVPLGSSPAATPINRSPITSRATSPASSSASLYSSISNVKEKFSQESVDGGAE